MDDGGARVITVTAPSGFSSSTEYVYIAVYDSTAKELRGYVTSAETAESVLDTFENNFTTSDWSATLGDDAFSPTEAEADSTVFWVAGWDRQLTQSERELLLTEPDPFDSETATPGIPATVLENADGALSTDTSITRTITLVSDSTELFTGSQTSDSETGELPEIDLSETVAEVDDEVDDRVTLDAPSSPGVVSTTVRRTVGDLGA